MKVEIGRQEMKPEKTRKGAEKKREREVEVRASGLTTNTRIVLVTAQRGNLLLTIISGEKLKKKRKEDRRTGEKERAKTTETTIKVKGDIENTRGRKVDTEKIVDSVLAKTNSEKITLKEGKIVPIDTGKKEIEVTEIVIVIIEKNLPKAISETSCGENEKHPLQMT